MSNKEEIKNKREDLSKKATEQQQRAANPAYSVWVEASAGTGKTKVLTDRVLRLLLSGVEPQKLLCLTYTKAAAVQMYDRISEYLGKWAVMSDEALDKDIKDLLGKAYSPQKKEEYMRRARILFADLLDTPGGIKINTIHSFCQEVLKRFPLESGVSPYFNLLDDRGKETALAAIKSEFLSGKYDKDSDVEEAITFFTHNSNEDSFSKVMEHI
ncbi:MAG: UvrD-helicase domain-containing protein, partial [Alphaproteobacteria bacterium]